MAIFHFYPIQGNFLLPLTLRDHVSLVVQLFMYEIIVCICYIQSYNLVIWNWRQFLWRQVWHYMKYISRLDWYMFISVHFISMLWTSFCWELERVLFKNGDASWYNLVRLECMSVSYLWVPVSLEWGYSGPMREQGGSQSFAGCCSMTSLLTAYTTNQDFWYAYFLSSSTQLWSELSGRGLETCLWKFFSPNYSWI